MRGRKWFILLGFAGILGANQLLWLTFAPIVTATEQYFGVNEFYANLLTLIIPAVYVLFSLHSGRRLDQFGYKTIVSISALVMLAGAVIRGLGGNHYGIVLFGQFLVALAQPYMTNAINQITVAWFERSELNMATGLVTGGMFIGMAVGALLPPLLVESMGFAGMMWLNAVLTLIPVVFFLLSIDEKKNAEAVEDTITLQEINSLMHNKELWFISWGVFLAFGYFNGLTSWVEPIIALNHLTAIQAGYVAAVLIVGGIAGSIVIPAPLARYFPLQFCSTFPILFYIFSVLRLFIGSTKRPLRCLIYLLVID